MRWTPRGFFFRLNGTQSNRHNADDTWSNLGSLKHWTHAKVDDAFTVYEDATITHESNISGIAIKNAARDVTKKVADWFPAICIFVSRDPAHSVDICSKDLAQTSVVKCVVAKAKEVQDFVKIDCIDSICLNMACNEELEVTSTCASMTETHMNLVHDFIVTAYK